MSDKPFRDNVIYPVIAALTVTFILAVLNYFDYSAARILGFEYSNIVEYKRQTFEYGQSLDNVGEKRIIYCPKNMVPLSCTALKYSSGIGNCGTTMLNGAETENDLAKLDPSQVVGEKTLPRCVINECGSPGNDQYWEATVACGKFQPIQ